MIRYFILLCSILALKSTMAQTTVFDAQMSLADEKLLRFALRLSEDSGSVKATLVNGSEKIPLLPSAWQGDSIDFEHPVFDSYIRIFRSDNEWKGFWHDRSRKGIYILPFTLEKRDPEFVESIRAAKSRWYCQFDTGENQYPAIGEFSVSGHQMSGTFLTETGDYRYLNGVITPDRYFELSAFDGSHAFYFEGNFIGDSLKGQFYSGNHWKTTFVGFRSDTARLPDGFALTKARIKGPITLKIMRGDAVVFDLDAPEYANKAVLIQVMGTWCPNCLDETQYLTQRKKMNVPMPELVALCFERGSDTTMQLNNLARVKKNLGLTYPLILAGKADKKTASEVLPFMDPVMSYPTTIFLNRNHEVMGIHTGFNGPATGQAYINQNKAFDRMMKEMAYELKIKN